MSLEFLLARFVELESRVVVLERENAVLRVENVSLKVETWRVKTASTRNSGDHGPVPPSMGPQRLGI